MTEIERILDQLKRAYEGEAWHGPSVREALAGVSAAQAHARPLNNAHSIWELTHHIAVWENAGRRRLEGDRAATERGHPVRLSAKREQFPLSVRTERAAHAGGQDVRDPCLANHLEHG